jgi:hypothetical protein
MLTSSELKEIPIFSCLNDANLMWLSQQAADLHLELGEYLIHEGEPTPFFVVMEGTTEVLNNPHSITASAANASAFLQTALSDLLRPLFLLLHTPDPRGAAPIES